MKTRAGHTSTQQLFFKAQNNKLFVNMNFFAAVISEFLNIFVWGLLCLRGMYHGDIAIKMSVRIIGTSFCVANNIHNTDMTALLLCVASDNDG
jgi:hypothetical protein